MGKKLYIRADGNKILGLGHLMRCMSIADAFVEIGGECEFVVADEEALHIVRERGYNAYVLYSKWDDLSGEIELMKKFVKENKVELLMVDSYYADEEYFIDLHNYTKIVYLTGKYDKCYDVDGLINYTIGSEKLNYIELYKNKSTKLYIGVEYAPLRKQFDVPLLIRDKVRDILVTTGGTDGLELPVILINEIKENAPSLFECNWHIVIGKFYSESVKRQLEELSKEYDNIRLYENVKDMADLMKACDLAISAAGSTLYELCACGVPTVAFSFVDNQCRALNEFEEAGYIFSVGDIRKDKNGSIGAIIDCVSELLEKDQLRKEKAVLMKGFIDGKGAKRLATQLQLL